jgi:hypothetical protein
MFKMEDKFLKIDRTKLVKISTYAKQQGVTPQRIYQMVAEGSIKLVEIDGVKFIHR